MITKRSPLSFFQHQKLRREQEQVQGVCTQETKALTQEAETQELDCSVQAGISLTQVKQRPSEEQSGCFPLVEAS